MGKIRLRCGFAAIGSGLLLVLPYPIAGPVPLWRTAVGWIALVPLLWALSLNGHSGKALSLKAFTALGYMCGVAWYAGTCYWIYQTMHIYGRIPAAASVGILILFCLYLGLYHALFGFVFGVVRRGWGQRWALCAAPLLWVAVELACARVTSFPWDQLGDSQVDNLLLTRIAPWTGAYGVSLVLAAVNALICLAIVTKQKQTRWVAAVVGLVIAAGLQAGVWMRIPAAGASNTAVMLQPNLLLDDTESWGSGQYERTMQQFAGLSRIKCQPVQLGMPNTEPRALPTYHCDAVDFQPDLIVWPEAPTPFEVHDPGFRTWMELLARETKAPVIVGHQTDQRDPAGERRWLMYNSASMVTPESGFQERYDKMHLVPFGEFVPFKKLFFFAGNLTQEAGDMSHGQRRVVLSAEGHSYGVFICYESVFADEVRQFALKGADVLVNISDDGWYGDTSAPWQHLNMVRMRAIENHRWILRDANTGVTTAIDPLGRVTMSAPRHVRTSLAAGFAYETDVTWYTRHGDWFAYLCAIISVGAVGFSALRLRRDASQ